MTTHLAPTSEPRGSGQPHIAILDGLRGIAALAVMAHHVGLMRNQSGLFSHAYLAVDFFFLLSGFVMGFAYESRMADGLSFVSFMRMRLGRLYPMILIGAVLGFLATTLQNHGVFPWLALAAQLVFFPFAVSRNDAYPLNNVQWSLFFEIFVNCVHAALYKWLSTFVITSVVLLSGIVLIFTDMHYGNLSIGYNSVNFIGGFPRVIFSYSTGLLIYRTFRAGRLWPMRFSYIWVALVLILLLAAPAVRILPDSLFVMFLFPVLLIAALGSRSPLFVRGLTRWGGSISYPLYAIHVPILIVAVILLPSSSNGLVHAVYWALVVGLIIAFAWAMECVYDAPIRRLLVRGRRAAREE